MLIFKDILLLIILSLKLLIQCGFFSDENMINVASNVCIAVMDMEFLKHYCLNNRYLGKWLVCHPGSYGHSKDRFEYVFKLINSISVSQSINTHSESHFHDIYILEKISCTVLWIYFRYLVLIENCIY